MLHEVEPSCFVFTHCRQVFAGILFFFLTRIDFMDLIKHSNVPLDVKNVLAFIGFDCVLEMVGDGSPVSSN